MSKSPLYTAPILTKLLAQQSEKRSPGLFKQGTFTLQWRGKVGSFPHPDLETIVSAGEPCGRWDWKPDRDFGDLGERLKQLPVSGYIPGSAIRGITRSWAIKHGRGHEVQDLLGNQDHNQEITSGKIEFLDAWPETQVNLSLDITNSQENFQVYHDNSEKGKPNPRPLYTLGNGNQSIDVTIAIRGIPSLALVTDVEQVWSWIEQALNFYGVGSRTASGYGRLKPQQRIVPISLTGYKTQELGFTLFSQGCYGPDQKSRINVELRPSHWRGWLRSWTLRFLLGVMSKNDAHLTLEDLFGTLESIAGGKSKQGKVRIEMLRGSQQQPWGDRSLDRPEFYAWKGKLQINAPTEILELIILPIVKFAVSVGGVGRGWRRPLHQFMGKRRGNDEPFSRGTYLTLMYKLEGEDRVKNFALPPDSKVWNNTYYKWKKAVEIKYSTKRSNRFSSSNLNLSQRGEIFSPETCAVYLVSGPKQEPINRDDLEWSTSNVRSTRGEGMELIYKTPQSSPPRNYKKNPEVGGDAAGGNAPSHCSWVSIKRVPVKDAGTKEVVCLFMGGQTPQANHDRSQFLSDLANTPGAVHLFGL
jgi:CRISPR-associated protein Cmr6